MCLLAFLTYYGCQETPPGGVGSVRGILSTLCTLTPFSPYPGTLNIGQGGSCFSDSQVGRVPLAVPLPQFPMAESPQARSSFGLSFYTGESLPHTIWSPQ